MKKAWMKGVNDARNGKSVKDCKYLDNSPQFFDYINGFAMALLTDLKIGTKRGKPEIKY